MIFLGFRKLPTVQYLFKLSPVPAINPLDITVSKVRNEDVTCLLIGAFYLIDYVMTYNCFQSGPQARAPKCSFHFWSKEHKKKKKEEPF